MSAPAKKQQNKRKKQGNRKPRQKQQQKAGSRPQPSNRKQGPRLDLYEEARKPQSEERIKQLIDQRVEMERLATDIRSVNGTKWMDVMINPLRDGYDFKAIKTDGALIPDGNAEPAVLLALTASTTFSGSTAAAGYICPTPYVYGSGVNTQIQIYSGGTFNVATSSPTTLTYSPCLEGTVADAVVTSTGKIRPFCYGLKVNPVSGTDSTSGSLQGGSWDGNLFGTSSSAFTTYAEAITSLDGKVFSVADGITVRNLYKAANANWTTVLSNSFGALAGELLRNFGHRPYVQFSGLSATTTLLIQCVWYFELKMVTNATPFTLPVRANEDEISKMVEFINAQPIVVKGKSFESFFKKVYEGAKTAFRFVQTNRETLTGLAKTAATLLL